MEETVPVEIVWPLGRVGVPGADANVFPVVGHRAIPRAGHGPDAALGQVGDGLRRVELHLGGTWFP